MTTLARTRAETLFASITSPADHAIESLALPLENMLKPHRAGPNTLHLPAGTLPVRLGWPVTRSRRLHKADGVTRTW